MASSKKTYEIDMCSGPIFGKLILFALPLMFSSMLQVLYNTADSVVVGRFAGSDALAAVSSNGSMINLIVALCLGLSVGVSVSIGNRFGARDYQGASESLHTSMLLSLICGIFLAVLGVGISRPVVRLMGTPESVMDQSVLYMRIIFIGMPANMVYNFGAAALRAVGDTRRPLLYLMVSGLLNVLLNLVFVIVFHMAADGVALATILSQILSAVLVTACLIRSEGMMKLNIKELKLHKKYLAEIVKIGLPSGVQGSIFSISNVLIQSAINSFGAMAMAGNGAAASLEGFLNLSCFSFATAGMSFASQNAGAKKHRRLIRVSLLCTLIVTVLATVLGWLCIFLDEPLLRIFTKDAEAIAFGSIRIRMMFGVYCTCALMDVFSGLQRGMGYSMTSMLVSVVGVCGVRMLWLYTVFAHFQTPEVLFLAYPVTWTMTTVMHVICFIVRLKKHIRLDEA